jgi:hypothetical protein
LKLRNAIFSQNVLKRTRKLAMIKAGKASATPGNPVIKAGKASATPGNPEKRNKQMN